MLRSLIVLCLSIVAAFAHAAEPARVMIIGTYHFSNPNKDLHDVKAVDMTTPKRQSELQAISDALAKFKPTLVAVEWPAELADTRYAQYLKGTLPASKNEVVQLGFRLAKQQGLEKVHGIDVDGDFPFEAVQKWAKLNGRAKELDALLEESGKAVARTDAIQQTHTIGSVLRDMNRPETIAEGHAFYAQMLRYGKGEEQPGVALDTAWAQRNYKICANLLQALKPGDHVVMIYGAGHAYLLRRCVSETPGVQLVDANDFLPE